MDALFAILVRSAAFVLGFATFPAAIVPRVVRLAFILTITIFALPLMPRTFASLSFAEFLVNLGKFDPPVMAGTALPAIMSEILLGILLGVAAGLGSLLAQTVALWIAGLLSTGEQEPKLAEILHGNSLATGIILLYLLALVPSLPALLEFIASSLLVIRPGQNIFLLHQQPTEVWLPLTLNLAKIIFMTAALLLLPFFALVVVCVGIFVPIHRSFRALATDSFVVALRYPIVLAMLLVTFYTLSSSLLIVPEYMLRHVSIQQLFFPVK